MPTNISYESILLKPPNQLYLWQQQQTTNCGLLFSGKNVTLNVPYTYRYECLKKCEHNIYKNIVNLLLSHTFYIDSSSNWTTELGVTCCQDDARSWTPWAHCRVVGAWVVLSKSLWQMQWTIFCLRKKKQCTVMTPGFNIIVQWLKLILFWSQDISR